VCLNFILHMGMGEIHWREEVDPINDRIKDRDIFLRKRYFSREEKLIAPLIAAPNGEMRKW
jgi:hypothetical protein